MALIAVDGDGLYPQGLTPLAVVDRTPRQPSGACSWVQTVKTGQGSPQSRPNHQPH